MAESTIQPIMNAIQQDIYMSYVLIYMSYELKSANGIGAGRGAHEEKKALLPSHPAQVVTRYSRAPLTLCSTLSVFCPF